MKQIKLQKWGNSHGIRISKEILNELGIATSNTTEFEIKVVGDSIQLIHINGVLSSKTKVKLKKWGNSHGIRISKEILNTLYIDTSNEVYFDVVIENDVIKLIHNEKRSSHLSYTKLQKWGNSQGVRISKEVLNKIGIASYDETQLEVTIEDGSIKLTPKSS